LDYGGTRGIGYLCAQHFIRHYGVKRLVLSGRDTLPRENTGELTNNEMASWAEKIRSVRTFEAEGAKVKVSSVL